MQAFNDGRKAVKAWRESGGAMNYECGGSVTPEVWWVGAVEEIATQIEDGHATVAQVREATKVALAAAGLTVHNYAEIDDLMLDWYDGPETVKAERAERARCLHGQIDPHGGHHGEGARCLLCGSTGWDWQLEEEGRERRKGHKK